MNEKLFLKHLLRREAEEARRYENDVDMVSVYGWIWALFTHMIPRYYAGLSEQQITENIQSMENSITGNASWDRKWLTNAISMLLDSEPTPPGELDTMQIAVSSIAQGIPEEYFNADLDFVETIMRESAP